MANTNVQQNVAVHFLARDQFSGPVAIMSAALATFSGAAIKMAADFDMAFAKVTSLLPQTKTQLEGFKAEVKDVSQTLGVDAVDAMNGLYEAISAGVPKDNAIDFLAVAAKSAVAGITNTKTAVDGLTSALNAFRIPTAEVTGVADQFFQAVNIGKQTFEELSAAMYVAAPIAANTGVALNELLAAQTSLTKSGSSAAVSMTQVRSALTALNKPSKNLQEVLEEMGYATGQAAIEGLGLQGTFEGIRATADAMNLPLSRVFGRVEAVNAVLGLTGPNAKAARGDLEELTHSTGAMQRAFDKIDDTPARRFSRAINELKLVFIDMGTAGLPVLEALSDVIGLIAAGFDAIPDSVQGSLVAFSAMIAIIGIAIALYTKLAATLSTVQKQFFLTASAAKTASAAQAQAGATAGATAGRFALTGIGKAGAIGLGAAVGITAIDAALQAFTGEGLWSRLFGGDGDEKIKQLERVQERLLQIKEITNDISKQELIKQADIDKLAKLLDENLFTSGGKENRFTGTFMNIKIHELEEFDDILKELSTTLLTFHGSGAELVKEFERLKKVLPELEFQRLVEGTEAGEKYLSALATINEEYLKTIPLHRDSSEGVREVGEAHRFAEGTILATLAVLEDEEDVLKTLDSALDQLTSRFTDMNPAVQANNVLIEMAALQIANIENAARTAEGGLRNLTDAEETQIKDLQTYIKSLETANSTTTQFEGVIQALRQSILANGEAVGQTEENLKTLSAVVEESTSSAPEAVRRLQLLQQTFDTQNPDKAIASFVALSQALGTESAEWIAIAQKIPEEYWLALLNGTSDPSKAAQLLGILAATMKGTFGAIDLSPFGANAAASFYRGMIQGMAQSGSLGGNLIGAGPEVGTDILDALANPLQIAAEELGAIIPESIYRGAGNAVSGGGSGGGGAEEAKKTAIDGFLSGFEDTMRAFILEKDFGELGGQLLDQLAEAIEENSESAGSAINSTIASIMDQLAERDPQEAEDFGRRLGDAVANAIQSRTPEAIQAVRDLVSSVASELANLQSVIDDAIGMLDTLGNAVMGALKSKYSGEHKAAMDALEARKKAARDQADAARKAARAGKSGGGGSSSGGSEPEDVSDEAIKGIQKEIEAARDAYNERRELIRKQVEDTVKAYQKQVDAYEDSLDEIDRAEEQRDHEKTLAQLEQDKRRAKTSFGRFKAQQAIDEELHRRSIQLERDEIQNRIKALRDEIAKIREIGEQRLDVLEKQFKAEEKLLEEKLEKEREAYEKSKKSARDAADAAREAARASSDAANSYFDTVMQNIDDGLQATLDAIDEEIEAQKKKYEDLTDEQELFNQALIILMGGGLSDIASLLEQYNPNWQNAGQSIGDALIYGLRSTKQDIAAAVNEIIGMINKGREAAGQAPIPTIGVTPDTPTSDRGNYTPPGGSSSGPPPIGTNFKGMIKPGWNFLTVDTATNTAAFGPGAQVYTIGPDGSYQLVGPGTPILKGTAVAVNSPNGYVAGSRFTQGGLALVGERGPEFVQLGAGSHVSNSSNTTSILNRLEQMMTYGGSMGGDNPIVVHVYIGQEKLDSYVVRAMSKKARLSY